MNTNNKDNSLPMLSQKVAEHAYHQLKNKVPGLSEVLYTTFLNRHYKLLAHLLCECCLAFGTVSNGSLLCSLKSRSFWGSEITVNQLLGQNTKPFIEAVVDLFYAMLLDDQEIQPHLANIGKSKRFACGLPARIRNELVDDIVSVIKIQPSTPLPPPHLVPFQNGIYDLREKVFMEYSDSVGVEAIRIASSFKSELQREYFEAKDKTKFIENTLPVWSKFMSQWFPNDPAMLTMMLRIFGLCMTTDDSRQIFFYFYGPAGAGKGSCAQTLFHLIGEGNYASIAFSSIDHRFRSAALQDKLVISVDEVKADLDGYAKVFNEVKRITGGEKIQLERKNKDPFESKIFGKIIMQSNNVPTLQDSGDAIRKRMIPIGFQKSFRGESAILPYQLILFAEADALATLSALAWGDVHSSDKPFLIEGCIAYQVGVSEVSEKLNLFSYCFGRYLIVDKSACVSSEALRELVELVHDEQESRISGNHASSIKKELLQHFAGKVCSTNKIKVNGSTKQVRGYEGIKFNKKPIIEDFPDLALSPTLSREIHEAG